MDTFSHVDAEGRASMVDVGSKRPQLRIARAAGRVRMAVATVKLIAENEIKKGDVLTVAEVAGIQAAKRTPELIPLCHPLQISKIGVKLDLEDNSVVAVSEVRCIDRTGVEMEALTAVSVALLTVYDMCKAVDSGMTIENIVLVEKEKVEDDG